MNSIKSALFVCVISFLVGCKASHPVINSETHSKAQSGDAEAQFEMGKAFFAAREFSDALPWLEQAAKQGHLKANYYLSQQYPQNGYECGIDCLKQLAEQGLSEAQYRLGGTYLDDQHGTPKDLSLAYKWILLAHSGSIAEHHGSGLISIFHLIKYYKISHLEISKGQKLAKDHTEKYGTSKSIY